MNPLAPGFVQKYRQNVELPDTLSTCSDEDLLMRFRRGQTEAFGVLLRRYERELYGYLRRYVGDGSLAEDVFQNTFLQLYLKIGQYEKGRPVREPEPFDLASGQERRERIRATVDQLPEFLRQVLILAYYQGLKYREIADIMDIPVGTVKSRLHAALVKLQEAWAESPSLYEV